MKKCGDTQKMQCLNITKIDVQKTTKNASQTGSGTTLKCAVWNVKCTVHFQKVFVDPQRPGGQTQSGPTKMHSVFTVPVPDGASKTGSCTVCFGMSCVSRLQSLDTQGNIGTCFCMQIFFSYLFLAIYNI